MGARELDDIEALLADAGHLVGRAASDGIAMPPALTLSQWADERRRLSRVNSSEPGHWRTERTPYLKEPMDCLSADSPVEEVVLMFGTQLGKTETGNNWIGYTIDIDPVPTMVVQPTQKVAKRWTKQRFNPMRDEMPELREKIADPRSRDSGNTAEMKEFAGGVLIIAGANSASDLRSTPIAKLYLDEIDNYPHDVDNEGDPVELAEARTDNFPRRKKLKTSSPTTKGFSRIEAAYEASDQCRYHVPCPHCWEYHVLRWEQIRWADVSVRDAERSDDDASGLEYDVGRAWYVCEHCGAEIDEAAKTWMLAQGRWVARYPGRRDGRVRGFHLSSLYSPLGWKSWAKCAAASLKAKKLAESGDDTKLKVFANTILAETYEEQGDKANAEAVRQRAEDYRLRTVPRGGLILTAAVDVQGNRLEAAIDAWGPGEESWLVEHLVLDGDPAQPEVWASLDTWLQQPLVHASGKLLYIAACAIDCGGHHTGEVYDFCGPRQARYVGDERVLQYVFAVKGANVGGKPVIGKPVDVEFSYRGRRIPRGTKRWEVGTDTAKAKIYGRLGIAQAGPGYLHFSNDLPREYYDQLTAERLVTRYIRGRPKLEWILPPGKRNEALDLKVYAYAAAVRLGIQRKNAAEWERERLRVDPPSRDLFAEAAQATPEPASSPPNAAPATHTQPARSWAPRHAGWAPRTR